MRRSALTYLFLFIVSLTGIRAQTTLYDEYGNQIDPSTQPDKLEDSTKVEIQSIPPKLYMWKLSERLGERTILPADTAMLNFQSSNLVGGMYGHYNYLGNLGAPRMSRLFFERRNDAPTIFLDPLSFFYTRPDEVLFTNSNVPYSNLTYYKAGDKVNGEERFKAYFSVNVNKRLAFGFNFDYIYGRGYYQYQSTSHINARLFASYIGDRYQMNAVYNDFTMKMNENGGIQDDRYITRPEDMASGGAEYETTTMPVKLEETANRNRDFYVYLTHRYRLGFKRETYQLEERKEPRRRPSGGPDMPSPGGDQGFGGRGGDMRDGNPPANDTIPVPKDTIIVEEFVPVTSFIHTVQVERSRHRFTSASETSGLYSNTYFNNSRSLDSTTYIGIKNTLGISLLEGFNKYAKAGLTAYISHKFSRYDLLDTLANTRYNEQEIFVGGELAKREGQTLHYNVNGEIGIMDKALGQFRVNADLDLNFRIGKDTVNFYARGYISNTLPSFYFRHYHSNHYYWDNDDMAKEFRTRVEGELNISQWKTNLKAGIENIKNYTYFNQSALPTQESGNIQVISAMLKQDFRLGILHLDNEVTWQQSSNQTVLPLPKLSLYHNVYLLTKLAKVLTLQLGADVRYFTKYHAPAYTPAIQQFHLQPTDDQVEISGYPLVNVYANFHLKRTRFFVMMYHVNAGMGSANYFLAPHYPLNQRLLKIGISWNFYD